MSTTDMALVEPETQQPGTGIRRLLRGLPSVDRSSPLLGWFGLTVAGAGFVLIAFTWGKVAGLLQVSKQLPYIVSGGLTGLGLVIVGMTIVNLAARRQDAAERSHQMEQLQAVLQDLRNLLEDT